MGADRTEMAADPDARKRKRTVPECPRRDKREMSERSPPSVAAFARRRGGT
jgi:hypothetical protein